MKTIYIDSDFKCHTTNPDGIFQEVQTTWFDGKCITFIEGYRFVPDGESWVREDGTIFTGEMISPWKDCEILNIAQHKYEKQILNEYKESLLELGVEV